MARPSKIDRLPQELRDAIGDLRRQGRTIDEILAHLRSLGVGDVSPWQSLAVVGVTFLLLATGTLHMLRAGYKLKH